jgi:hypothetical protein
LGTGEEGVTRDTRDKEAVFRVILDAPMENTCIFRKNPWGLRKDLKMKNHDHSSYCERKQEISSV